MPRNIYMNSEAKWSLCLRPNMGNRLPSMKKCSSMRQDMPLWLIPTYVYRTWFIVSSFVLWWFLFVPRAVVLERGLIAGDIFWWTIKKYWHSCGPSISPKILHVRHFLRMCLREWLSLTEVWLQKYWQKYFDGTFKTNDILWAQHSSKIYYDIKCNTFPENLWVCWTMVCFLPCC